MAATDKSLGQSPDKAKRLATGAGNFALANPPAGFEYMKSWISFGSWSEEDLNIVAFIQFDGAGAEKRVYQVEAMAFD